MKILGIKLRTLVFFIFIGVYLFAYMMTIYDENLYHLSVIIRMFFYFFCVLMIVSGVYFRKVLSYFELYLTVYILSFSLLLFYHDDFNLSALNATLFPAVSALAASIILNDKKLKNVYELKRISFAFVVLYVFNIVFYTYKVIFSGVTQGLVVNTIYFSFCCLPFVFFIKNYFLKLILLMAMLFVSYFVGKETPLLVTAAAIMLLVFNKLAEYINVKSKFTFKVVLAYLTISIPLILVLFSVIGVIGVVDINSVSSGRIDIYDRVLTDISNQGLLLSLFGSGFNSVANVYGISAHNDFLEVIYNFGILGLILYLGIYFFIISLIFKCYRENLGEAAKISMVVLIVFFLTSLVSNLIFVPSYIALIFISYILCDNYSKVDKGI